MRRQSILILAILLGLLAACGLIVAGSAAVIIRARLTRAPETTVLRQSAVPPQPLAANTPAPMPRAPDQASAGINRLVILGSDGNIYTSRPDGSDRQALTQDAAPDHFYRQPAWSPTGERLAWVEIRAQDGAVHSGLSTGRPDGGDLSYTDTAAYAPFYISWSPDGRRVALLSNWTSGLALRLLNPGEQNREPSLLARGQPLYFSWAPDSTQTPGARKRRKPGGDCLGQGRATAVRRARQLRSAAVE